MKSYALFVLLLALPFCTPCFCQSNLSQAQIKGFVFDPGDSPAQYSTVVLMNQDSVFMKGMMTGADGMFRFVNLSKRRYFIMIRNVEFNTFVSDPVTLDGNHVVEFKHIRLKRKINDLEEVEVKAVKPLYVQKSDRLEVNVESNATMAGNNALEILEKSPGVLVNRQNNSISLKGKDGVSVMINDRLTHMPMSALFGMLEGMSASNIEKLELIDAPPSNFDAEGEGGFINIILKKDENDGLNVMISTTAGFGRKERTLAGGNFTFRKKKFRIYGNYNFNYSHMKEYGHSGRIISDPSYEFRMASQTNRRIHQYLHNAQLGFDYEVTPNTVIGILGTFYHRRWTMNSDIHTSFAGDPGPDSTGAGTREELSKSGQYLVNLNFQHIFNERSRLKTDLDYFSRNSLQPIHYFNTFQDESGLELSREELITGKNTPLDIWVGSVDYTYKMAERFKFEAGVKENYSFFRNELIYQSRVNDLWVSDPGFAESASMSESVQAVYLSVNYTMDEKTSLKTGIRYERTSTNLKLRSDNPDIQRRFNDIFPTLFFARKFNEHNSLSVAYNRRISRPGFYDLAPFVLFIDPLTYITGNVKLLPAISSSFKAAYSFRKLLVSAQYMWVHNSIKRFQPWRLPDSDLGVLSSLNLDLEERYNLSLSLPVDITGWWKMQNNVNWYYNRIDSDYQGGHLKISRDAFIVNTSHMFLLPRDFSVDVSFFYFSRAQEGIMLKKPREILNIGIQKLFTNHRGTLTFNITNVFNSPYIDSRAMVPNLNMEQYTYVDSDLRVMKLTYTVKFGNNEVKSRNKRESGAEDILKRVGR